MIQKKRLLALFLGAVMLCVLLSGCGQTKETKAYAFHDVYIGAEYLLNNHDRSSCEDMYLNEDGSLTMVLTEAQRKHWANPRQVEAILLPLQMMGVSISYHQDYTQMTVSAPDGVAEAAAPMICNFAWVAELYQVLNGNESWSLDVTVINSDTGQILQQVTLPDEELDWSFIGQ